MREMFGCRSRIVLPLADAVKFAGACTQSQASRAAHRAYSSPALPRQL